MKNRTFAFVSLLSAAVVIAPGQEVFDLLRKGDVPAVKALVEKSPQLVEARDAQGLTLLHYAAYGRSPDLIDFLIDKGAKPDVKDAEADTPLHIAAMNDRTEVAAALLKRGASIEARDDYQRTPLILCARERGQPATGRVLIDAGADINAVDKFGDSALGLAAWRGKAGFVDMLLDKGALVPESGERWRDGVSQAASQGLANLFRRLTQGGRDPKSADPSGQSLLHSAAAGGSAEIVGLLLEKGFSAAAADRFGWTPLHYAARDGRAEAIRILIERGAPLDARTAMGQTAYNVALEREMRAAAALLAEKGADKSALRFPVLQGDYLGQKPPAESPELFAPGIISSIWGLHSTAVFSPDGGEVYWTPMMLFPGEVYSRGGLLTMKRVNGRWTPPAWTSFSGPQGEDDVPFFSPDGKRMYFMSRRPVPGDARGRSERIWFTDRTAEGWAEPKPLDPNVNSMEMHWAFSLDREKNVYFAGRAPEGLGMVDIYVARFKDGTYEKPVNLGEPVNSAAIEDSPFIAPDGSYLLFSRQFDIWLSFRSAEGAWSAPVNLGPEVNSPAIEVCPRVTDDGKYIFFLSQRGGESHAYWARADIIEKLRPSPPGTFRTLAGENRTVQEADRFLHELMRTSSVSAMSVAVVQDDRVAFERVFGVVDKKSGQPAGPGTVFRAASLSKPVFSYLVMKLVDEGLLGLDQPLAGFVDPPFTSYPEYASLKGDARLAALTPAILLSHSPGFPNWRRPRWTGPLPFLFEPGAEFSYSGEGYHLLQFLIEKKTGRDLNALAKEKVFGPLGMGRSAFLWEDRFDDDFAVELESGLGPLIRRSRTLAVSAGSLLSNASDYAKFLVAALSGQGLEPGTAAAWRTPRQRVGGRALHDRRKPETSLNEDVQLSWTPGWGWFRSSAGPALFHVGAEEGCENYVVLFPEKRTAIVVFSVSGTPTRITPPIVETLIGDVHSPFAWMRY